MFMRYSGGGAAAAVEATRAVDSRAMDAREVSTDAYQSGSWSEKDTLRAAKQAADVANAVWRSEPRLRGMALQAVRPRADSKSHEAALEALRKLKSSEGKRGLREHSRRAVAIAEARRTTARNAWAVMKAAGRPRHEVALAAARAVVTTLRDHRTKSDKSSGGGYRQSVSSGEKQNAAVAVLASAVAILSAFLV